MMLPISKGAPVSLEARIAQYNGEYVKQGNKMRCKYCNLLVFHKRKGHCDKHLLTKRHLRNKEAAKFSLKNVEDQTTSGEITPTIQSKQINITAESRAGMYPQGTFHTKGDQMICSTCNKVIEFINLKGIEIHLSSRKHIRLLKEVTDEAPVDCICNQAKPPRGNRKKMGKCSQCQKYHCRLSKSCKYSNMSLGIMLQHTQSVSHPDATSFVSECSYCESTKDRHQELIGKCPPPCEGIYCTYDNCDTEFQKRTVKGTLQQHYLLQHKKDVDQSIFTRLLLKLMSKQQPTRPRASKDETNIADQKPTTIQEQVSTSITRQKQERPFRITAEARADSYPEGTFHVVDGQMTCFSCNEVVNFSDKSVIMNHLKSQKHRINSGQLKPGLLKRQSRQQPKDQDKDVTKQPSSAQQKDREMFECDAESDEATEN